MKDQKIQSPAPAKKIRREKRVAYNNARTCLFKNLRAIFLNGHDDFEVIIGEKFDDVPVRQADNGQGYVIAFKTDSYGFSEEEAQILTVRLPPYLTKRMPFYLKTLIIKE